MGIREYGALSALLSMDIGSPAFTITHDLFESAYDQLRQIRRRLPRRIKPRSKPPKVLKRRAANRAARKARRRNRS